MHKISRQQIFEILKWHRESNCVPRICWFFIWQKQNKHWIWKWSTWRKQQRHQKTHTDINILFKYHHEHVWIYKIYWPFYASKLKWFFLCKCARGLFTNYSIFPMCYVVFRIFVCVFFFFCTSLAWNYIYRVHAEWKR